MDGLVYCKGARSERTAQLEKKHRKLSFRQQQRPTRRLNEGVKERQRLLEEAMTKDNFVKCRTEALDPKDPGYGKPQEGSRTAERGKKAHKHVHREILELCEVSYLFCTVYNNYKI